MVEQGIFKSSVYLKLGAAFFTFIIVLFLTQDILFTISPLSRLEQKFIDERFEARGPVDIEDSSDIIILEITQDSYDQIPPPYNSWPWPRSYFARVIKNLNEAGVKAIGVDIVMSNKDKYSAANDSLLFHAIGKFRNIVVAGKVDVNREFTVSRLNNTGNNILVRKQNENFSNLFFDADSSIGIVQAVSDNDGVYRKYVPYVYSEVIKKRIPTFAYAVLNKYYGLNSFYTAENSDEYYSYNDVKIPKYKENTALINFYGPNNTFPRVKFIDVLDDKEFKTIDEVEFDEEINTWDNEEYGLKYSGMFENKIVLIGSTLPEDKDLIPVSFSPGQREGDNYLYGVEFHANAIQNFINKDFLYSPSPAMEILILFIIVFLAFYITGYIKKIKTRFSFITEIVSIAVILLIIIIFYQVSIYFFTNYKMVLPIVDPSLAIIFGYFGSTVYEFFAERRRNMMIKGMFGQYVSRNLVNELIENPDKLKLGGESKELTILFCDLAGFTSFSEGKKPEEVVSYINEFLDEMSEIILKYNGTLDKYLGDSIMAFWGAPIPIKEHAYLACKAALEMNERLKTLNKKWESKDNILRMRVGINSGIVVVGNIGGKKRFDYTVMGDNVNLASRLEGANKIFGSSLMISEPTYKLVKERFVARELDTIRVKGKTKPTKVYELLGNYDDEKIRVRNKEFLDYFTGLTEYKKANFEDALQLFKNCYEKLKDNVSLAYIERCEEFINNPPPPDWDAVTNLTEK